MANRAINREVAVSARTRSPSDNALAALRHGQDQTNRFFGTIAGTVPIPEFSSPEKVQRIVSGG